MYSPEGSTTCLLCPPGYQCPNPFLKENCPDGTYSPGGLVTCISKIETGIFFKSIRYIY